MSDPVWAKLEKINALRKLWLDVVKLPMTGIDLKNEMLVITLAHPAHLQEWRMGEERYMQSLRQEYKQRELKKIAVFRKIIVKENIHKEMKIAEEKQETYKERSKGCFKNHCTHPKLSKIFEDIAEDIRRNHDTKTKDLS